MLDRDLEDIEVNGNAIRVGGINEYCYNHYLKDKVYRASGGYRFMTRFCDTDSFKLLLCHQPNFYFPQSRDLVYEDWDCDLVLSGHTHGGLIRIPFIGSLYLPQQGLFPKLDKGLKDVGKAQMVIGGGLGDHGMWIRINSPHELILIRLVPEE